MKTDFFQSCGHCWVFQICWCIECSTFTASFFRIWNSSTGIPSPPLALFVGMLSKGHLTSHYSMSGSRWVITPSWLSVSWRSLVYSSSVHSSHVFLISSASVRSVPFLPFIEPIFAWIVPLVSLEEICSVSHSIVSLYFFALITEEIFLISPCYSLESCIQTGISFLSSLLFASLLFTAICKASSDSYFLFCISFSWGWSWSLSPVQCHKPTSIVHQALCLSDLVP